MAIKLGDLDMKRLCKRYCSRFLARRINFEQSSSYFHCKNGMFEPKSQILKKQVTSIFLPRST